MLGLVLRLFRREAEAHKELLTLDQRLDALSDRLEREDDAYRDRLNDHSNILAERLGHEDAHYADRLHDKANHQHGTAKA